ncbi:MAG: TonB-dependent receptor [Sphingobacteriales bacterium]|nr:MAG: TonB-dependent receptor [Sphingobacteriales bacterium]
MLIALNSQYAFSQSAGSKVVNGVITDASSREPVAGATVTAKSTGRATSTNGEGKFTLTVAEADDITIRSLGYENMVVNVSGKSNIIATLKSTNSSLNDVVIVGFATQKKVNLTGAVSVVNEKVLASRPITAVSTGLQGTVPGLSVVSTRGQPGASNGEVRVRGIGTFNNSDPYILIDGVPGDMNWINPEDIATISVLKDAAASSIYGTRAANGVILITTKKGMADQKATIFYSGYFGFQKPTALPKMLGSVEYMTMLGEAQVNAGLPKSYTDAQIEIARNGSDPNYFANTDWPNALIKPSAGQQNHNVNISGGGKDVQYFMSYGRQNQDGLVVGDQYKFKKDNVRLKLNTARILNVLDLEANLSYLDRNQNQPSSSTDVGGGPIYTALTMSPLNPVRFTSGGWGYGGGSSNPVAIATDGGFNNFVSKEFTSSFVGKLHILNNLDITSQYGLRGTSQKRVTFNRTIQYFDPVTNAVIYTTGSPNSLQNIATTITFKNFSTQIDYRLNLDKNHFKVLTGYQQESNRFDAFSASANNFVDDNVPVLNLGTSNFNAGGDAYQYATQGVFGRLNYDYSEKYLLELNLRYDGSSRYAEGHRWGVFPSVSAGWRFTEESFIKRNTMNWLSDGKIRASYGTLGNQFGADGSAYSEYYPYANTIGSVATAPIGNGSAPTSAFAQTILSNPLLEWEKASMLNLAVDLSFLNNRLSFTGEWFNKKISDIQIKVPQPDILGLAVPDQNAGGMSNKGYELSLGWNDRIKDFKYGVTAMLFDIKNKVTDLGGVPPTIGDRIRNVGYPLNAFYGYRTDGLAQESDFTRNAAGAYIPKFAIMDQYAGKIAPGDIKYRDLNGDGKITADLDREVIGDAFPRYNYSFRFDASWKNFDFTAFLQGVGKNSGYITGPGLHAYNADAAFPQEIHLDHWTPTNTGASYPRFIYKDTRNTAPVSDYWLQDASYLRLKNVQVGYTVPAMLIQKLHIQQLRFYVSGDNLLTRTNYYYAYDPESPATSGGLYPQVKTFIFGINIKLQ